MTLKMRHHPNKDDWDTLPTKEMFKVLKEAFPKGTDKSGQTIYEYLGEKAKLFDFDIFDLTKLVDQFCEVLQKLDTMQISPGDVKQSIKQLTRDIINGVGGTEGTRRFLSNEVEKEKPSTLEAYFEFILSTHYETNQVALEAIRRGIITHLDEGSSREQGKTDRQSSMQPGEPSAKRPRTELITPNSGYCNGCGRVGHRWKDCAFVKYGHPDHNADPTIAWPDCPSGIEWDKLGEKTLPSRRNLARKPFDYGPLNEVLRKRFRWRLVSSVTARGACWYCPCVPAQPDRAVRLPIPLTLIEMMFYLGHVMNFEAVI